MGHGQTIVVGEYSTQQLVDEGKTLTSALKQQVVKDKGFTIDALKKAYQRANKANKLEAKKSHGNQVPTDELELGLVSFIAYCACSTAVTNKTLLVEFVNEVYGKTDPSSGVTSSRTSTKIILLNVRSRCCRRRELDWRK